MLYDLTWIYLVEAHSNSSECSISGYCKIYLEYWMIGFLDFIVLSFSNVSTLKITVSKVNHSLLSSSPFKRIFVLFFLLRFSDVWAYQLNYTFVAIVRVCVPKHPIILLCFSLRTVFYTHQYKVSCNKICCYWCSLVYTIEIRIEIACLELSEIEPPFESNIE